MQLTTLLPFLGLATALPATSNLANSNTITQEIAWNVSNFKLGCSSGGCYYDFNITGNGNNYTPKFSTHCKGAENKKVYCDDKNITTTVVPSGNPLWAVDVTHRWTTYLDAEHHDLATWYQEGAKNVTVVDHKPFNFTMKPTEEYGVA
ncbi:hypothetical protein N7467_001703 [Penicillium canescens]|nr:hypothetical protein N7467_001703 [Penicillium canescens]